MKAHGGWHITRSDRPKSSPEVKSLYALPGRPSAFGLLVLLLTTDSSTKAPPLSAHATAALTSSWACTGDGKQCSSPEDPWMCASLLPA